MLSRSSMRELVFKYIYGKEIQGEDSEDQLDLFIETLEGTMHAQLNDYIMRGIKGEFYPCAREIFEETYEIVE